MHGRKRSGINFHGLGKRESIEYHLKKRSFRQPYKKASEVNILNFFPLLLLFFCRRLYGTNGNSHKRLLLNKGTKGTQCWSKLTGLHGSRWLQHLGSSLTSNTSLRSCWLIFPVAWGQQTFCNIRVISCPWWRIGNRMLGVSGWERLSCWRTQPSESRFNYCQNLFGSHSSDPVITGITHPLFIQTHGENLWWKSIG